MTVTTGKKSACRFAFRLGVLALGTASLALSAGALAQQDDHNGHGNGNGGNGPPHQQQSDRQAPAAAPSRAPAQMQAQAPVQTQQRGPAPAARDQNWRNPAAWQGQFRAAPVNPAGNGGQPRGAQPNQAPAQSQPAYQHQPRGDGQRGASATQGWNDGNHGHNDQGDRGDRGDRHDNGGPGRYDNGPGHAPGYGRPPAGGQWNHGWRQDNRYDWRGWREENRDDFHAGRYYPPYRDYSYNRLGIGIYLPPLFFGSDYWISDAEYYHLPPVYGPYHWVRYYDDAILVNTYNGEVADVIYDFFW